MNNPKFRAWDCIDKKMWVVKDYLALYIHNDTWSVVDNLTGDTKVVSEAGVLMQYTGLEDKDGVEICEGGIVCTSFMKDHRGEIIYHRAGFFIAGDDGYLESLSHVARYKCTIEVIGNIYENPELLNKKK